MIPSSPASARTLSLSENWPEFGAKTPAVVIGAHAHGLGVVRSLRKGGMPLVVVDDDPRRPAMHSRYARPFVVSAMSGPALIDELVTLGAWLTDRPLLFMTDDIQVHTISEHRKRLADLFRFRLPEHQCVSNLLHKWQFQQAAEKHGLPVPRAIRVDDERALSGLASMRFPAVVKPGTKELFVTKKAPRARKVWSREEAEAVCRQILPTAPDLVVQEWIEGAETDIYFCLQYRGKDGIVVSSFTGRKLRCWPPQTGNTASCVAAPDMVAVLEPLAKAFFDKMGFVGMCSMEFKRDRRSGAFLVVEPTVGRTDWQEEVATLNGVNIPLAAYCYELSLPLPATEKVYAPMIWRDSAAYWRSVFVTRSFREGAPQNAQVKSTCWRVDDPVPLIFFWLEWIRKIWRPNHWRGVARRHGGTGCNCI